MPKYKCERHGNDVVVFPAKTVDVGKEKRSCVLCMNEYFSRVYGVTEMVEVKEEKG